MKDMLINTAFIMIFLSICLSIIANNSQYGQADPVSNKAWLQTSAASYYLAAFLILVIWGYYSLKIKYNAGLFDNSNREAISQVLSPLPAAITGLVLIFAASQLLIYQTRLVEKRVVNEYYEWSRTFTFLLILQLILLVTSATNNFQLKSYNYLIYVLCLINVIILGIKHILLHFFSTDG